MPPKDILVERHGVVQIRMDDSFFITPHFFIGHCILGTNGVDCSSEAGPLNGETCHVSDVVLFSVPSYGFESRLCPFRFGLGFEKSIIGNPYANSDASSSLDLIQLPKVMVKRLLQKEVGAAKNKLVGTHQSRRVILQIPLKVWDHRDVVEAGYWGIGEIR